MIYVHVPFCRSFCTYCGFYSEICSRKETQQVQNRLFEDYAEALCDEIDSRREEISAARGLSSAEAASSEIVGSGNRGTGNVLRTPPKQALVPPSYVAEGGTVSSTPVPGTEGGTSLQQELQTSPDSLYIGGGTPSVLPLAVLERIVRALGPATYREFTVEVNPDDIVASGVEYVAGLRALGVNRVSMGVQSFDDGILRWMNRRHDAAGSREAFRLLRAGGFDNVSIDLIFGLSQLTETIWESTIDEALALGPEHISAYQLSIEEDSALEKMVADGRYNEASDEQCRSQYDVLCRKLAKAGYVHYEISNWARPGREAVHNNAYWRRVPYVGLGPGAHSLAFPGSAAPHSPHGEQKPRFCSQEVPLQPRYEQIASFCSEEGDEQFKNEQKPRFCSQEVPLQPRYEQNASFCSGVGDEQFKNEQKPRFCSQEVPLQPRYKQNASFCSEVGDEQPKNEQKHAFCSCGGIRSWNSQELPRREADGRLVRWRSGHEALSEREAAEETVMLGLRTAAGLPLSRLRDISPADAVDALLAEGALVLITPVPDTPDAPFVRIPEDHFFVSDDIIARLLP